MINDILDGISKAIGDTFGDIYKIYGDEETEQGVERPCFFISLVTSSTKNEPSKRYLDLNTFEISFFPAAKKSRAEMHTVGDALKNILKVLTLLNGTKLRGVNVHVEVVDGALHFFVTYQAYTSTPNTEEPMEAFTWEGRTP